MNRRGDRKVLMVAPRWDYGDPARGDSFEFDYFGSAMRNISPTVHFVDLQELGRLSPDEQYRVLSQEASRIGATVVFSVLFRDEISPSTIARFRNSQGVPFVNWFCDDHWRYDSFSRRLAPSLSLCVTTDPGAACQYRADGFRVHKSQWGAPLSKVASLDVTTQVDNRVTFVGQVYGRRSRVLDELPGLLSPTDLELFGFGTQNGRVSVSDMYGLFNGSLASLNFADSWNGRLREMVGRLAPKVRRPRQLKARTFEVPGAGGVLITQQTNELASYFEIETEVFVAESADQIAGIVGMLRANPAVREAVARRARKRTLEEHTVERRLEEMFRELDV